MVNEDWPILVEKKLDNLSKRLEQVEQRGAAKMLWRWWVKRDPWQVISLLLFLALTLVLSSGTAWGNYTHYTNDPAYWSAETQKVIQDPYGVNECPSGNCVVYWGPIGPTRWQDIEAAGWPYELTRTFLAARYPIGLPDHFHFDHDAAAKLLVQGLAVPALDRLFIWDEGYGALPTTEG